MFRILEKATEGHGYEVVEFWLTGPKAGMFKITVDVKINNTLLRAKTDDLCEHRPAGGLWIISGKKETESLLAEFNTIRKGKGWLPKSFKRIDEWINPQDEA